MIHHPPFPIYIPFVHFSPNQRNLTSIRNLPQFTVYPLVSLPTKLHPKMHRRDKFHKEQTPKYSYTPSFSSSLLDEIYRSIDDHHDAGIPEINPVRTSRYTALPPPAKFTGPRPAFHVEKWMDKGRIINSKPVRKSSILPEWGEIHDSDSSFSDDELAHTKPSSSITCFKPKPKPKPVRTTRRNDSRTKSRSAVLKLYASLKKMRQPISPGGKLTSFINSLFANNKSKKNPIFKENFESAQPQLPSSSILRPPSLRSTGDHQLQQRKVRFHPVNVIVDQDSKPCGQKRPPLSPKIRAPANYHRKNEILRLWKDEEDEEEEEEEDAASESSSDLFEIDHLRLFGRRSSEFPVYETTSSIHK